MIHHPPKSWLRAASRMFFSDSIFTDLQSLDLIARRHNEHLLHDVGIRRTPALENRGCFWP